MPNELKPGKTKANNIATDDDPQLFKFDKPWEELTPQERKLSTLRKYTKVDRQLGAQRTAETRLLDKQLQRNFKRNAKAYSKIIKDIPDLSAIDVMKMCIHMALNDNDYDLAGKWAKELAEYEKPKLQRKEVLLTDNTKDLSDEELFQKAFEEGLLPDHLINNTVAVALEKAQLN